MSRKKDPSRMKVGELLQALRVANEKEKEMVSEILIYLVRARVSHQELNSLFVCEKQPDWKKGMISETMSGMHMPESHSQLTFA